MDAEKLKNELPKVGHDCIPSNEQTVLHHSSSVFNSRSQIGKVPLVITKKYVIAMTSEIQLGPELKSELHLFKKKKKK